MGEVDSGPVAPAEPMPDLTVLEVDPAKGERFYKAALIHSKQGTTYRMVAKAIADGRLDLVHFVCDLSADGTMIGKRRIRRIESQRPERWDRRVEASLLPLATRPRVMSSQRSISKTANGSGSLHTPKR